MTNITIVVILLITIFIYFTLQYLDPKIRSWAYGDVRLCLSKNQTLGPNLNPSTIQIQAHTFIFKIQIS